ncbi:hypothetical protein Ct9H90mP29_23170 [bacterium]|nr:MAG: hypothetical protein Ct9H90mP29_23170 [bacterium]
MAAGWAQDTVVSNSWMKWTKWRDIIDYSVYDAIQAGFNKVVFIIREDFKDVFKITISDKYKGLINTELVFQDLHDLPGNFNCPKERKKPWGTGHAILAAREVKKEPFQP